MQSSGETDSGGIFLIIIAVVCICTLGATYKQLRFLTNPKVAKAEVFHGTRKDPPLFSKEPPTYPYYTYTPKPEYFEFNLYVKIEGIEYTIKKRSESVSTFKSWKPKPKYNWLELRGKTITVYYSDDVKIATTFKDQNTKPTFFNLLSSIRSRATYAGFILLAIMLSAVIISGGGYLILSVIDTYKGIELPKTSSGSFVSYLKYCNDIVAPSTSLVLAIYFIVLLGIVLTKGMLFVESRGSFISGTYLFIGAVISSFGPGLIVRVFYYLKASPSSDTCKGIKNEILRTIKNLFLIPVFVKLVISLTMFFSKCNFRELNGEPTRKFIYQIFSALIS